jgi:hypothetical protein
MIFEITARQSLPEAFLRTRSKLRSRNVTHNDERENQCKQGDRFNQGEPDPAVFSDPCFRIGLSADGLNRFGENVTDSKTGTVEADRT